MHDLFFLSAVTLGAYLLGAIPFGYLVARSRGIDIFAHGSGNIGATNVGRTLGNRFGALVFVLDFAKGALPVAIGKWLELRHPLHSVPAGSLAVAAGLAAFLGHIFPIYLQFRGGKGVATGAGVVAVLAPLPTFLGILTWLTVLSATKHVAVASIVAALVICLSQLTFARMGGGLDPPTIFCLLAASLVVVRHRSNILNLYHGAEEPQKEYSTMSQLGKILHVLAVGLWFGSSLFFSFGVALPLFDTFEQVAKEEKRPAWFPRSSAFIKVDTAIDGPKEQGSRAAGFIVSPMFAILFPLQAICGLTAAGTALSWLKRGSVHRWRAIVLILALATVATGWPIEREVSDLRVKRNEATDAYLSLAPDDCCLPGAAPDVAMTAPSPENVQSRAVMDAARTQFAHWHLVSVLLNLLTCSLVTVAMALAAFVPKWEFKDSSHESESSSQEAVAGDTTAIL